MKTSSLGVWMVSSVVALCGCDDTGDASTDAVSSAEASVEVDGQLDAEPDGRLDGAHEADAAGPDAARAEAGPRVDAQPPDAAGDAGPAPCGARAESAGQLEAFYGAHGGRGAFPPRYAELLEAFFAIDDATRCGDFEDARARLDAVWAAWPLSDGRWWSFDAGAHGTNVGSPLTYYALRMLDEVIDRGLGPAVEADPVTLTVLLVGCSEGLQPRNWAELEAGEGVPYRGTLEAGVLADDHRVFRESLDLFTRYVPALTDGRLSLQLRFEPLPELCLPAVSQAAPSRLASIDSGPLWAAVPQETLRSTDWWWLVYPSRVPEQHPDFVETEFITGGMGRGPNGGPLFISDDRWLLRKPPHLGQGPMSAVERRAYLPQWLQHEFFHHLFQIFHEFGLEEMGHQWFDRGTWPEDFVGAWEPDYYAEALRKRIRGAEPPAHVRLRYRAPSPEELGQISLDDLVGTYVRRPEDNDWHRGRLSRDGEGLRWTNEAGVSWALDPDLAEGRLRSGPDNPYYDPEAPRRADFLVALERDAEGVYRPGVVAGFDFGGERYHREGD